MSEIKVRNDHPDPDGRTLGVVLEDGDIYPVTVPKAGHVPTEIDGRKVSKEFRDGLLEQDGWTLVRPTARTRVRPTATKKLADSAEATPADNDNAPETGKDGE